jgi:site-specific recombinase XerD
MDNYSKKISSAFKRLEGAYAPNTIKSYYADVTQFVDWCDVKSLPAFPLDDKVLVEFIEAHQFTLKYATVRRKLAALRKINSLLGCPDVAHSQEFHLTLRRMRRGQSAERRQARGINEDLLLRMIAAQPRTLTGTRNRALLSLGYDFLARRSELTALEVGDIKFSEGGGLRAVIRRSKGDQFGRGRLVYGSRRSAKHLRAWLKCLPKGGGLIFRAVGGGKVLDRPLCGRSVSDIVKLSVVKARGLRPRECEASGHSLRVGAAQDLLVRGHDICAIMRAGGWDSVRVVSNYLRLAEHNIWE